MKILGTKASLQTQRVAEKTGRDRRLANLRPFKPGQSGNPAGAKPGYKSMAAALRRYIDMDITEFQKQLGANPSLLLQAKGKTVGEVLALMHLAVCQAPVKGHDAREKLMDRVEGKVPIEIGDSTLEFMRDLMADADGKTRGLPPRPDGSKRDGTE